MFSTLSLTEASGSVCDLDRYCNDGMYMWFGTCSENIIISVWYLTYMSPGGMESYVYVAMSQQVWPLLSFVGLVRRVVLLRYFGLGLVRKCMNKNEMREW